MSHEALKHLLSSECRWVGIKTGAAGDSACATHAEPILSRGLPWLSLEQSIRWIGDRLFYFPSGIPRGSRVSIVSSRLSQRLDLETRWLDLLRTVTLHCDMSSDFIVVSEGSTGAHAISRAATLFARPLLRFQVADLADNATEDLLFKWLDQYASVSGGLSSSESESIASQPSPLSDVRAYPATVTRIQVSPALVGPPHGSRHGFEDLNSVPLNDRILFASASRICVLSSRFGGNIRKLLQIHLNDNERRSTPVLIASDSNGKFAQHMSLLPPGWIPWLVLPDLNNTESVPESGVSVNDEPHDDTDNNTVITQSDRGEVSIVKHQGDNAVKRTVKRKTENESNPLTQPEDWLLHWTRAGTGPWPEEPLNDYLDKLLLQAEDADHSALSTLFRIIRSQRLIASSRGIRGGYSVVAFTEVPLSEFRRRRKFRSHHRRFDFEPWGIALNRQRLSSMGARPVTYGNDQDWQQLSDTDRPYFQKSTVGRSNCVEEREWRHFGDVQLGSFLPDCLWIFANDDESCRLIRKQCPWPAIRVPDDPEGADRP